MSPTKEMLHSLIDNVNTSEYELLYSLLLKFVPETDPLPDEIEAIKSSQLDSQLISYDNIDWD